MNAQLVDSIVQLIGSLDAEDYALLQAQLQTRAIQRTPGVCGGCARIRNTRIALWTLVSFRQQGAGDDELLHNYPGLVGSDLVAAWAYYDRHREEIDREIALNQNDEAEE